MISITNTNELLRNAKSNLDSKAREIAINALNAALEAADPKSIIKSKVKAKGNTLKVENLSFNLDEFKRVFVVGGGKACGSMAEALEEILDDRIKEGAVNVPYASPPYHTRRVKLQHASHPIPDIAGVKGAKRMLDLVSHAKKNDLIICLLS